MQKRFVYTDSEGRCCIVFGVNKDILEKQLGPMTEEDYIKLVLKGLPKDASDLHEIQEEDAPKDRTFRNAWAFDKTSKKIMVDEKKAAILYGDKFKGLENVISEDATNTI